MGRILSQPPQFSDTKYGLGSRVRVTGQGYGSGLRVRVRGQGYGRGYGLGLREGVELTCPKIGARTLDIRCRCLTISCAEPSHELSQMGELLTMALTQGPHECRSTVRAELWDADNARDARDASKAGRDLDMDMEMDKMQFSLSESYAASV